MSLACGPGLLCPPCAQPTLRYDDRRAEQSRVPERVVKAPPELPEEISMLLDSYRTPLTVAGRLADRVDVRTFRHRQTRLTFQGTAAYMASGGLACSQQPWPRSRDCSNSLAGLAIASGFMARWAALVLAVFTVVASSCFIATGRCPRTRQAVQQLLFMKNLSVIGGLLILALRWGQGLPVWAGASRRYVCRLRCAADAHLQCSAWAAMGNPGDNQQFHHRETTSARPGKRPSVCAAT